MKAGFDMDNKIEKYCKGLCRCCIVLEDGRIECLNTWGCPYDVIDNGYGLD